MMDTVTTVVSLITAIISLATAITVYKTTKNK